MGDSTIGLSKEEVLQMFERLLATMPELSDFDWIEKNAGFSYSTILAMKSKIGNTKQPFTTQQWTKVIYPFLDTYSWNKTRAYLEEIIADPTSNPFHFNNVIRENRYKP